MPSVAATLQATITELRATIAEQRPTIVRLEERVRDLEARMGRNTGNTYPPPSSELPEPPTHPPSRPRCRGRGGQPGHDAVAVIQIKDPDEIVVDVTARDDQWPGAHLA